jgi:asparagine synthase (glutamine-hydrolysing)
MCGICGCIGTHRPELLKAMSDTMVCRGPDDSGIWTDESAEVGFAHRRLSIIDLSPAGHQPMANADGSIQITYNGEIYNFQDFYDDLAARGYRFRGKSDTEVLLYLYETYGIEFLEKLNGIFALAIWDARKQELLLARDHAGIKPLYYWVDGDRLYFASEIKALLQIPGIPRELNHDALSAYFTLLWVPGEETMLKGIKKVEPGEYLVWKNGRAEIKQWFHLAYEPDESVSEEEWIERVHDTFMSTTRRQMVSDVPLGAFLSGGLDSSSIVACMRQSFPERDITCYTIAYDPKHLEREGFENDYPYAKRVAEHLDVDLKTLFLEPDSVNLLPKMVYHMDEPDSDPTAIATYLVSKMAREDGTKVLLSGTGGDEVFFGYRSHQAYRHLERLGIVPRGITKAGLSAAYAISSSMQGAQSALPRRLRKFKEAFSAQGFDRHLALVDWSNQETREALFSPGLKEKIGSTGSEMASLRKYFDQFEGEGALNQHSHVLIQTFLAAHNFLYTDKCGMATTVENRVPFMDVELMRLCATIPERYKLKGNETKYLLKKAMERYLPSDVIYRGKTGFTPPIREWIINGLEPMIEEYLSEERLTLRGLFEPREVQKILADNRSNKRDHGYLIYALLNLEIWQQTFIDQPGVMLSD